MMATTRISASIRDTVIHNVLNAKFSTKAGELQLLQDARNKLRDELRQMAYETCYSKKERDLIASLPDGWLGTATAGQVMVNGRVTQVLFDELRPVPFNSSSSFYGSKPVSAVLDDGHPYLLKMEELRVADEKLDQFSRSYNEERSSLKVRVRAILESVTTVNRLIEIWPEVVDFLPETVSDPITGVPAIMIADLNRDLGIPSKKAA